MIEFEDAFEGLIGMGLMLFVYAFRLAATGEVAVGAVEMLWWIAFGCIGIGMSSWLKRKNSVS